MKITLSRQSFGKGCTLGYLYVDGELQCKTLEPPVREVPGAPVASWKILDKTAIPAGTYPISIRLSPRFRKMKIHIENVPGFDQIMIHEGNVVEDTDACVLVGQSFGPDDAHVLQSIIALTALQPKVESAIGRGDEVSIDVHNAAQTTT